MATSVKALVFAPGLFVFIGITFICSTNNYHATLNNVSNIILKIAL